MKKVRVLSWKQRLTLAVWRAESKKNAKLWPVASCHKRKQ